MDVTSVAAPAHVRDDVTMDLTATVPAARATETAHASAFAHLLAHPTFDDGNTTAAFEVRVFLSCVVDPVDLASQATTTMAPLSLAAVVAHYAAKPTTSVVAVDATATMNLTDVVVQSVAVRVDTAVGATAAGDTTAALLDETSAVGAQFISVPANDTVLDGLTSDFGDHYTGILEHVRSLRERAVADDVDNDDDVNVDDESTAALAESTCVMPIAPPATLADIAVSHDTDAHRARLVLPPSSHDETAQLAARAERANAAADAVQARAEIDDAMRRAVADITGPISVTTHDTQQTTVLAQRAAIAQREAAAVAQRVAPTRVPVVDERTKQAFAEVSIAVLHA
jgi:hypothetical protein